MESIESQRALLIVLGAVTLIALVVVLGFGPGSVWVLHLLGAGVAAACAFAACARLSLDMPNAAIRRAWQAAAVLLFLVALGRIAAPFGAGIAGYRLVADAAGWLLLAAAAALLWRMMKDAAMAPAAAPVLWTGLALHVLAMVAAVAALGDGSGAIGDPARRAFPAAFLALLALQFYLLGIALAFAAARHRQFIRQHRVADIGDYARYLFVHFHLFRRLRHPTLRLGFIPGGKPGLDLARFLAWFPKLAPQVRARCGIGIWQQFRTLFVASFRHGLDTQTYYMFELYRPEAWPRASGYLTRYEVKNGLYKVLSLQLPKKGAHRIGLGDKLGMTELFETEGIPTVPILAVAAEGRLSLRCRDRAALERDLFIKPQHSKGSRGTEAIRYVDGRFLTEDGQSLDHDGLAAFVAARAKAKPFLLQPRIVNHPGLADLADQALMRIRAITILDPAGKPVLTHAVLSNLCKLETAWPTDIELGAAIDLETGALGMMTGDKAAMWLDWSEDHPITHNRVLDRIVPCWGEVRDMVLAAHAVCSDRLLVGWDIAIAPEGAVMLEGNTLPDVDFLQRAHRCPIGDSPLGPLLFGRLLDLEHRAAAGTLQGVKYFATRRAPAPPPTPDAPALPLPPATPHRRRP